MHKRFRLTADEPFREMNNRAALFPVDITDSADYLWSLYPQGWRATKVCNFLPGLSLNELCLRNTLKDAAASFKQGAQNLSSQ